MDSRKFYQYLEMIQKNKNNLSLLETPEGRIGLKDDECNQLCLKALEIHGLDVLKLIPQEMWTRDLCIAAVTKVVKELQELQELEKKPNQIKLSTEEYSQIYRAAYDIFYKVIQKEEGAKVLDFLKDPENRRWLKDDEYIKLCKEAIDKYGSSCLDDIDPSVMTYSLLLRALKKNLVAVKYVYDHVEIQKRLKNEDKYLEFFEKAIKKVNKAIKKEAIENKASEENVGSRISSRNRSINSGYRLFFHCLPRELKTFDICRTIAEQNVNVLSHLKTPKDRPESLTSKEYADLCLVVIENQFSNKLKKIDPDHKNALKNFIARYESINEHLGYKMDDLGTFFAGYISEISDLYSLLGKGVFTLMEKLMKTSGDNLKRFLDQIKGLGPTMLDNASKNISNLLENVDFTNATQKASYLKLYLFLDHKEKKEINKLLEELNNLPVELNNLLEELNQLPDDNTKDIEKIKNQEKKIQDRIKELVIKIPDRIKGLVIKRFYNGLELPYNPDKQTALHALSNEQLADLYGLFEKLQEDPKGDKSKMFFSLLKMHLTGIPFENLHQPDEMRKKGDEYMVQMATHNKELREKLAAGHIDVDKAFSYGKKDEEKQPLEYDEHQRQKIFEVLRAIGTKMVGIYKLIPETEKEKAEKEKAKKKKAEKEKAEKVKAKKDETKKEKTENYDAIPIPKKTKEKTENDDAIPIPKKTEEEIAKINKFIAENPNAVNKLKKLMKQIMKKGDPNVLTESKLHTMLSKENFPMLIGIVFDKVFDSVLPNIKDQFLELTKLLDINYEFLTKQADTKDQELESEKLVTKGNVLENYKPRKYHIEMWDKREFQTFFLGDYLSCCLATTGTKSTEYAPRVFDDAFLMPVIIDESTNKPVCGAWLFLGEVTQPPSNEKKIGVVANFFEINAGLAENEELMKFLQVNLLNYIGQFSDSINAKEFIMRPLTYGHIPDFDTLGTFTKTENRSVEKIGGYFGNEIYYLDAVTDTSNFYKYDSAKFSEQNRKLIAPKPKAPEISPELKGPEVTSEPKGTGIATKPKVTEIAIESKAPEIASEPKGTGIATKPKATKNVSTTKFGIFPIKPTVVSPKTVQPTTQEQQTTQNNTQKNTSFKPQNR